VRETKEDCWKVGKPIQVPLERPIGIQEFAAHRAFGRVVRKYDIVVTKVSGWAMVSGFKKAI